MIRLVALLLILLQPSGLGGLAVCGVMELAHEESCTPAGTHHERGHTGSTLTAHAAAMPAPCDAMAGCASSPPSLVAQHSVLVAAPDADAGAPDGFDASFATFSVGPPVPPPNA